MSEQAWAHMMSLCCLCHQIFSYNPHKVPSIRLKAGKPDPTGERETICKACMDRANAVRRARGLPELPILPGAYEPLPAEEL